MSYFTPNRCLKSLSFGEKKYCFVLIVENQSNT